MVNAGDSVRRVSTHTCHKHCKSREETKTGGMIPSLDNIFRSLTLIRRDRPLSDMQEVEQS